MRRVLASVVVAAGLLTSGCVTVSTDDGDEQGDASPSEQTSAAGAPAEPGSESNPAPLGKPADGALARFKVTDVRLEDKRLNPSVPGPDGVYVIVTLSVTNTSAAMVSVAYSDMLVVAGDTQISATDDGWQLAKPEPMSYDDIRPGLEIVRSVVFDVPPKDAKGAVLLAITSDVEGPTGEQVFLALD